MGTNALLTVRARDATERAEAAKARASELERRLESLSGQQPQGSPLKAIAHAVEKLRGLRFAREVTPRLLTRAELAREIEERFVADNDAEAVRASGRVLASLGLLDHGADLYEILKAITISQVVGFYDPEDGDLVTLAEDARAPSPYTRVALAHELTHALTDQRLDTSRLETLQEERADDEAYAFLSLLEGDATWVMQEYLRSLAPEDQASFAAEDPSGGGPALPGFLEDVLTFPYVEGTSFVDAVRERGGHELLDRVYSDPPASTEQILHPARYLDDRDDPVEVKVPGLARGLGDGWERLDAGGFGELDLRVVLDGDDAHPFLSGSEARTAADGWDGGAYDSAVSDGRAVVGAVVAFDSVSEAVQAVRSFGRWLPARFDRNGRSFEVAGPGGRGWDAGAAGAGAVVRRGDRILLAVGDRATDVLRALEVLRAS